jgi:hypothetical protein
MGTPRIYVGEGGHAFQQIVKEPGSEHATSTVRRLPILAVNTFYGREADSALCFVGTSAIHAAPIATRTATPISSPREIMLRIACVPITVAVNTQAIIGIWSHSDR